MENIGLATVPAEQKPYVGRFIKQAQIRAASAAKPKDEIRYNKLRKKKET